MSGNETELLYSALCYEQGHKRRTQHILKVYALAKLLGEKEEFSEEEREILQAAAILHDIAIRYCKEHYDGDAGQKNQKKEAPRMVREFLKAAGYSLSVIPRVTELVLKHHDYDGPKDRILQVLMEADIIVNCWEEIPDEEKLRKYRAIFRTPAGTELFEVMGFGHTISA